MFAAQMLSALQSPGCAQRFWNVKSQYMVISLYDLIGTDMAVVPSCMFCIVKRLPTHPSLELLTVTLIVGSVCHCFIAHLVHQVMLGMLF